MPRSKYLPTSCSLNSSGEGVNPGRHDQFEYMVMTALVLERISDHLCAWTIDNLNFFETTSRILTSLVQTRI